MRTTKEVFEHHTQALLSGNLEEIGKDYVESSRLLAPNLGVQSGKSAILKAFEGFLAIFKGGGFKVKATLVEGNAVLIVWDFESPDAAVQDGVDSFFIDKGVIMYHTSAFNLIKKG
ncbi:MAG: nuclear transport factor 2 family protein [Spirochaetia bacterium]|jgi:predicted SnoaL-like aldol condensation-catalyzing enzyme